MNENAELDRIWAEETQKMHDEYYNYENLEDENMALEEIVDKLKYEIKDIEKTFKDTNVNVEEYVFQSKDYLFGYIDALKDILNIVEEYL